jgi:hypothetical protein
VFSHTKFIAKHIILEGLIFHAYILIGLNNTKK